jgi:hypothetical protein
VKTPSAMRFFSTTLHDMNDEPCTDKQLEAIRLAAKDRQHYIRWLADWLERSDDLTLRKAASKELRQLVGEE